MPKRTPNLNLFEHDTTNDEDLNSNFDIDTALNDNWDKIDAAYGNLNTNKVNKELKTGSQSEYKVLSDNNFTSDEKTKLSGVATGAQVNVLEGLTLGGSNLTVSGKKIEIKDPEVTGARQSTIKDKTFASVDARLEELEEDVDNIETTRGHVYGVRRKITNNSSSAWERLFDSVGKTANATKNGGTVVNDFDNLAPWSEIKSCNYDLTTKKIKAWFGDVGFKFDGTNGDVFTYFPDTYIKIYQDNDYDYILVADYPRAGFTHYDGFFIARYAAGLVDGTLRSYSGLVPAHNKTIGQFRTLANALGSNFSLLDWRHFIIQALYLVEYANYNAQSSVGQGIRNSQQSTALLTESNVNRIIVSSTSLYVGRTIGIGSAYASFSVATDRKITAIADYSDGTITGKVITFDGEPVNIAEGNIIWGCGQESGQCDSLGMKSGCINNDNYHSVIYRGIENWFANMWQFVDGINIKDRVAYICKDHSEYASDKFTDPYKALGYTNGDTNGYSKALGFDPDEPLFRFPTEVGGSDSSYMADYYYQNTGNRVARVGGHFNGSGDCGPWSWNLNIDSSFSNVYIGCRVLIDNQ